MCKSHGGTQNRGANGSVRDPFWMAHLPKGLKDPDTLIDDQLPPPLAGLNFDARQASLGRTRRFDFSARENESVHEPGQRRTIAGYRRNVADWLAGEVAD
jgi:hypothetical protein